MVENYIEGIFPPIRVPFGGMLGFKTIGLGVGVKNKLLFDLSAASTQAMAYVRDMYYRLRSQFGLVNYSQSHVLYELVSASFVGTLVFDSALKGEQRAESAEEVTAAEEVVAGSVQGEENIGRKVLLKRLRLRVET
ncbi:hypothetical protein RND71_003518 [Anisodus tanguticus]|uniref:Uncharacterized protein n=1 Tax=Anisodus tanguticus TaxID=243964 RepID=A0AAE1SY22_9SOLA|nr:hypothetical protein RND71_003518 [Anisodus tanguticus]